MSRELKEKLSEIFIMEYPRRSSMDKYEDMAYFNERGIEWLSTLAKPEIWSKWVYKVQRNMRGSKVFGTPEEYAKRIILEAIWHRGYTKDLTNNRTMARCARRLRQPRDRGEGIDPRNRDLSAADLTTHGIPREFELFDEFLENVVRLEL